MICTKNAANGWLVCICFIYFHVDSNVLDHENEQTLQPTQLDKENEIHLQPDALPLWDLVDFGVWQQ